MKLAELEEEFLREGWLVEGESEEFIQSYVESVGNGWTADQVSDWQPMVAGLALTVVWD